MSDTTRQKWDARYREAASAAGPVEVLLENRLLIPRTGRALDLACGLGGNALFLAARGLDVHAWDISSVAIAQLNKEARRRGLALHAECRDVLRRPPAAMSFDLIVVSRFLDRSLCPRIVQALKPNGLLLYQTYTQARLPGKGPNCADFLLQDGELLALFSGLEVVEYREGEEAQLVARKGEGKPPPRGGN